ncbi:alcohol dehydrogenase [Bifidobacterium commune]|uniref:Threonine dehydrogenase n=1 Tax=Bifidobacterium commune TaxID=1505727 RepID=A0A1C4H7B2_9BIFI|nr:alcohol dehydrogenase [Bifidobacterium commune]SCC80745.1 Threonine dehydrogenase [Bifidobacterium commune]
MNTTTMKAAVFEGPANIEVKTVPRPELKEDGDIVIRVVRACVCGSDLWFYRGIEDRARGEQTGHEAIGVVEQAGAGVHSVAPGDFVIVPFPFSCGTCPVCKAGFESSCPNGGYFGNGDLGCQAEFLRVPQADGTVVKVDEPEGGFGDAMLASLLTLSDVMATGYHAAASAEVKAGDTAVVMGDGAVGLCAVIAAKLRGASRIIAMSRHEDRSALACKFGATDIVPERGQAAIDKVLSMTDGYGADAVLECVGSAESFVTALGVARRGSVVGRVGVPHDEKLDGDRMFYDNIGLRGGPAPVRSYDKAVLLDKVLDGSINPGRVFTAQFDINHIADAYKAMDERNAIKSMIVF